jgi:hypothetical protein
LSNVIVDSLPSTVGASVRLGHKGPELAVLGFIAQDQAAGQMGGTRQIMALQAQ